MEKPSIIDQYNQTKVNYPSYIVLFRIGGFYEIFGSDVDHVSKILKLKITFKKNTPMCGFPKTALLSNVAVLIKNHMKVVICEESSNSSHGLIIRKVEQIFTPGTVIDDFLMNASQNNFLMFCYEDKEKYHITLADISTSEMYYTTGDVDYLKFVVNFWRPSEILSSQNLHLQDVIDIQNMCYSSLLEAKINKDNALLQANLNDIAKVSAEIVLDYVAFVNIGSYPTHMKMPIDLSEHGTMYLYCFTIHNLEIFSNMQGDKLRSISAILDDTVTSFGSRLLRRRLMQPTCLIDKINHRLNNIERLLENYVKLRSILCKFQDVQRAVSRIAFGYKQAQDLIVCVDAFAAIVDVISCINSCNYETIKPIACLHEMHEFGLYLRSIIEYDDTQKIIVRSIYSKKLSELASHKENLVRYALTIVQRYVIDIGMEIKISEVANKIYMVVPKDQERYIPYSFKQIESEGHTYYTTDEIQVVSDKFEEVLAKIDEEEDNALQYIFAEIALKYDSIIDMSAIIADLDVSSAFAKKAHQNRYTKPIMTSGRDFYIEQGRHILIEDILHECIPNDCQMYPLSNILMTGPNMSGKTTFAKQNAIISYLAHIGCFVPANKAVIGVSDQIFVRTGANDDLSNGFSTFMVEMNELSRILHDATDKSFIVIDEIGRGTDAKTGEAIAQAALEHLLKVNSRVIFSTHYLHLSSVIDNIQKLHLSSNIKNGEIEFSYKISYGVHSKSYAEAIAKRASIPSSVLSRIHELLHS